MSLACWEIIPPLMSFPRAFRYIKSAFASSGSDTVITEQLSQTLILMHSMSAFRVAPKRPLSVLFGSHRSMLKILRAETQTDVTDHVSLRIW